MFIEKTVNGLTFDKQSIVQFIKLVEQKEWSDKDISELISTDGIQYLIKQEKESFNCNEDAVRTYLHQVYQGYSGECGGWTTAFKEKIKTKNRLDYMMNRWNYLVERPLSVVMEYLPDHYLGEGTCYFLPAGSQESYSDEDGFAINLGCGAQKDNHWMFSIAREGFLHCLTRIAGKEPSISACETANQFVETFFSITHRQGIATLVALKAANMEDLFYREHLSHIEEKIALYSEAFQLALEGNIMSKESIEKEVFSGYTSPSALLGVFMAHTMDTFDKPVGQALGREAILATVSKRGFFPFFEIFHGLTSGNSPVPDVVWEAFEMIKIKRGVKRVNEGFFLGCR